MDWFSELNGLTQTAGQNKPDATDWFGQLNGTAPAQDAQKPSAPKGNIISRAVDAIKGKHDPAYAHVPTFDEGGFSTVTSGLVGKLTGQDDKAYGDILSKSLGDRFKRRITDANGYDIIEYTDDKGQIKQGYVNKPGLDTEDVSRGLFQAIPYAIGGMVTGGLMKGAPAALRVPAQMGTAGSTSVVGDIAAMGVGSEQGVDKTKAVTAAAGAGLFEMLPSRAAMATIGGLGGGAYGVSQGSDTPGHAYDPGNVLAKTGIGSAAGLAASLMARRVFGMSPGTYAQGGKLTPQGERAAIEGGVEPKDLQGLVADEFAKTYAKTRDASQAAVGATQSYFKIPASRGQMTKDPQRLMEEKAMRQGLYGDNAKSVMQEFDQNQSRAIGNAAFGDTAAFGTTGAADAQSVAGLIAPHRFGKAPVADIGAGIREGVAQSREAAKMAEREAWKGATEIKPSQEALDLLPQVIRRDLGELGIPVNANTPNAEKMVGVLRDYRAGKAPTAGDEFIPEMKGQNVDQIRRSLGAMSRDKTLTPTDKAASEGVYRAFNKWIGEAADAGHFPAETVAAMRAGRQVSAEVKGLFEPRQGASLTPGGKRLQQVMQGADTPEGIISGLIGDVSMKGLPKAGSYEALENLKSALWKFGDKEIGQQTWNDIRLAYWQRIALGKNGDVLTPARILENIKLAEKNQGSIYKLLMEPMERSEISKFKRALEGVVWKDPNPSGTATAVAIFSKQFLDKLMQSMPLVRTAYQMSGIPKAMGTVAANKAVSQKVREVAPSLGPVGGGTGSILDFMRSE